jgi:aspartate/methionine/tyrosine aminotransferase
MHRFESEGFEAVLRLVAQRRSRGERVLPLHAGEPDFPTPEPIVRAAHEALDDGDTRYTPAVGKPELRSAIAAHVRRTRNVEVGPEHVVVAPGAKPVVYFALLMLTEPGDDVLYLSPAYPIYRSLARFLGVNPVAVPMRIADGAAGIDIDALEAAVTPRTRAIILNSPSNPTGAVLSAETLAEIAAIVERHDLAVISDEIYSEMVYGTTFASIASIPGMLERTVLVDGYSKTFAMTGWRLGYGVMPSEIADHFSKLMTNTLSCNVAFTQRAAIAALEMPPAVVQDMIAALRARRDLFVDGLDGIPGVACARPQGAFYAFADFRELGVDSASASLALLRDHGVAAYPGTAFGRDYDGFVRFSFGGRPDILREALHEIRAYAHALG